MLYWSRRFSRLWTYVLAFLPGVASPPGSSVTSARPVSLKCVLMKLIMQAWPPSTRTKSLYMHPKSVVEEGKEEEEEEEEEEAEEEAEEEEDEEGN